MKALAAAALAMAIAHPACAEIFGVIKTPDQNIVLSDRRGPCPIDYNVAFRMVSRNGAPAGQGGCYRITNDNRIKIYILADNNPAGALFSFDDFVLSDYYRRMNVLK